MITVSCSNNINTQIPLNNNNISNQKKKYRIKKIIDNSSNTELNSSIQAFCVLATKIFNSLQQQDSYQEKSLHNAPRWGKNNHKIPLFADAVLHNKTIHVPATHNLEIGSAQVKSAILLAGMNVKGMTKIIENIPSRNHTEIMLKHLGANLNVDNNVISLTSPNFLKPKDLYIPGDFSSAAFVIVAVLLSVKSKVKIKDVGLNYYRIGLLEVLKKMNAKILVNNKRKFNGEVVGDIEVRSSNLLGITVRKQISPRLIDEYPILFVAASFASGTSKFYGLDELKVKESNRLKTMAKALSESGVKLVLGKDSIEIFGEKFQRGGTQIITESDHRVAMSMLIFGFFSKNSIIIDDMRMIKTSFPGFRDLFQSLGANIEHIQKH